MADVSRIACEEWSRHWYIGTWGEKMRYFDFNVEITYFAEIDLFDFVSL